MYNLLSTNNRRLLKILGLLAKNDEVSIYDIMKVNSCSERTAYSDISRIEKSGVSGFSISIRSKYVSSEYLSNQIIESYAFSIINSDIKIKLLFELLFYPHQDLMQYAIELDVSSVHLNSAIKDLNIFLSKHNSEIVREDSKYFIKADDECSFRVMIAEYINVSPDRFNEFTSKVFPEVMYSKFSHVFEYDLSKGFMLTLEMFSNLRVQQGFSVTKEMLSEEEQFTHILERFVTVLDNNKEDFDSLAIELTSFIIEYLLVTDEKTIKEIIELIFSILVRHIISGYIEYVEVDRLSIFCYNFDNKYRYTSNHFKEFMSKLLKDKYDINLNRVIDEIKFFTYINIPESLKIKPKDVLISSDLGKEHCYTLVKTFKSMYSEHNFIMVKSDDIKEYLKLNNDISLIITNFNFSLQDYRTLYVSDFLTTDDLQNVYESLYIN